MEITKLSSNKRALLEKYLQGKVGQEQNVADSIRKRTPGTVLPLSLMQQQMWVLAQLIPDVPVYNESFTRVLARFSQYNCVRAEFQRGDQAS